MLICLAKILQADLSSELSVVNVKAFTEGKKHLPREKWYLQVYNQAIVSLNNG